MGTQYRDTSLLQIIFLGDPKQLRATVKTHGQNTKDHIVNIFADHFLISFFKCLWSRDCETYLSTEQYRLAECLEEVSSDLFHGRKRTNAIYIYTKLENLLNAVEAIQFIRRQYSIFDNIPNLWLNVTDGVTLRGANHGRFNPNNIIATTNAIRLMLKENL